MVKGWSYLRQLGEDIFIPTGQFLLALWLVATLIVPMADYSFNEPYGKGVFFIFWIIGAFFIYKIFTIGKEGKQKTAKRLIYWGGFVLFQAVLLYYLRHFT